MELYLTLVTIIEGFYVEPRLVKEGISEMPIFESLFKRYRFDWITKESVRYS